MFYEVGLTSVLCGAFDRAIGARDAIFTTVKRMKRAIRDDNSSLTWVLPYPTAELENNHEDYENYYDNIEICEESCNAHFKGGNTNEK